jgi:hypothetical protein
MEKVAKGEVVPMPSEPVTVALPKDAPPKALSWLEMVVDPVTASAVEVAPTKVAPPLNASGEVVALAMKGYAKVA